MTTANVEFWSLPWHALQRSLANGFGTEPPGNPLGPLLGSSNAAAPSAGNSWLARARSGAPQMRPTRR